MVNYGDIIGKIIYALRTKNGISQEQLCERLCSISTLSRIENGNNIPNRILTETLFQRMGKSIDRYDYAIGKNEYKQYNIRKEIIDAYEDGDRELALKKLNHFRSVITDGDNLGKQFVKEMELFICERQFNSIEETVKVLLGILRITVPNIKLGNLNNHYLSLKELKLYFLIGIKYSEFGDIYSSNRLLEEIIYYLDIRYQDEDVRIKLYPQVVYLFSEQLFETGEYNKVLINCKKAAELLIRNSCIWYLAKILKLQSEAMKCIIKKTDKGTLNDGSQDYIRLERQAECLEAILKEHLPDSNHNTYRMANMHEEMRRGMNFQDEIVKNQRKFMNMTQEDLSEYICSVESISHIERGKKTLSTKNYQLIMERLGQSTEHYKSYVYTDDFNIHDKVYSISMYISKLQFEEAEKLFLEVLPDLSDKIPQNRQFIIFTKALLDKRMGKLNEKDVLRYYEEAIRCTIPSYEQGRTDIFKIILSKLEVEIICNIASIFKKIGKLQIATDMIKNVLDSYRESEILITYHNGTYTFALTQYAADLGLLGCYTEAINTHNEVLKLQILNGECDYIGNSLYGIAWNLLKIDINNKEVCKKLCRQAYIVCEIMQLDYYMKWIEKKYVSTYEESLII